MKKRYLKKKPFKMCWVHFMIKKKETKIFFTMFAKFERFFSINDEMTLALKIKCKIFIIISHVKSIFIKCFSLSLYVVAFCFNSKLFPSLSALQVYWS